MLRWEVRVNTCGPQAGGNTLLKQSIRTNVHLYKVAFICVDYRRIALGCGLDDRDSRGRFPTVAGNFRHRFQNGSGTHLASYPMGTRDSFLGDKATGA